MEILMILTGGIIITVAVYLLMTRSILRVVFGIIMLSHGVHLLILTLAGLEEGAPPLLTENADAYTDPLPQALILTAIVISFGVTAFLLVLAYQTNKAHDSDDLEELRGNADE
ncbi:Na(+)/H(+) antiporter subunit C [Alkalicoccus urumqiensis]|uniref:Na(+)/H(+) antiporter subunit C n=1 Tax=Alkalicoccus urumqiensis TaxID=1548213 RepID=A0A2P6MFP3_ALKUR|nr:Na(+)/H(+) antiporter subunit C [Alkalicoccus urumqiensis]PRO65071.1 Na(+)/H(+) antiporter subunit C [Alkalicoccus urumqiensis]